jgi:hypothetical protein
MARQGTSRSTPRIGTLAAIVCVLIALILDWLQFFFSLFHAFNALDVIPVVGPAIGVTGSAIAVIIPLAIALFAFLGFGFYFFFCGINYFGGKQMALKTLGMFGSLAIELVPLLDDLPAITAGVLTVIIASRIEDAKKKRGANVQVPRFNVQQGRRAAVAQSVLRIQTENRERREEAARASAAQPQVTRGGRNESPTAQAAVAEFTRRAKSAAPPVQEFPDNPLYKASKPVTDWQERLLRGKSPSAIEAERIARNEPSIRSDIPANDNDIPTEEGREAA